MLDIIVKEVEARLDTLVDSWEGEEVPAITLPENHWRCKSCEWRTTCGNVADEDVSEAEVIGSNISEHEVQDAFLQWEEQRAIELENKADDKLMKWARGMLKNYAMERGIKKFERTGKHGEYTVSLQDRTAVVVNVDKARRYLTPSQWADAAEVISLSLIHI